jgi:cell division protein FtsQ
MTKTPSKPRRNRYKKDTAKQFRQWWGHVVTGLKLICVVAVLLGTSALFMVGYAAVTSSDYFRTQTIQVFGNQRLCEQTILDQAGIRAGENLLALNLRLVRERLMDHPWIETARVTRDIPETIAIRVQEHVPVARVDLGRLFFLNSKGRVFKEVADGDPDDLPLVSGIVYADLCLGTDDLGPALSAVMQVLRMCQGQTGALSYSQIARLHLDGELGITLTLKQHARSVKLGFGDYEAKFERYNALTGHLARNERWRDFAAVDLNNPDRVVVQLANPL